jgi:hypothetical protein
MGNTSDEGNSAAGANGCDGLPDGAAQFNELARVAGLAVVANDGVVVPEIRIVDNLAEVALKLGQVMNRVELFEQNGDLVFFDHRGERKVMTARIFRTWLQGRVLLFEKRNKSDDPLPTVLGIEAAATVLDAEQFRRGVRVLRGVNAVRLPVIRAGKSKPELLPYGYDDESGIFTVESGLDYDEDMAIEAARGWMERTFGKFPMASPRSMAVQMAAMLALYIRHLPGGSSLRPGFLWLANKAESGKSVQAKAAQYAVLGRAPAVKMKQGEQLDKEMEAFMIAGASCIFLDNVYGGINSATIDQMLTSEESEGRAMGGHGLFRAKNSAVLFVTGNRLELNDDAERRFLVVDLFEAGDPMDRPVERGEILNDDVMKSPEWRRRMLAALWAMVRHWGEQGKPEGSVVRGSFETYSRLLGGIVESCGYEPPFTRAEIADAINPEKAEFIEILKLVVEDMGLVKARDYSMEELVRFARLAQVFEKQVGTDSEGRRLTVTHEKLSKEDAPFAVDKGYMTEAHRSSFGKKMKRMAGGKSKVGALTVEFGKREQARKSTFSVTIL